MGAHDAERRPLWHADFLKIVAAHFLTCASLYMFLPLAPVMAGQGCGVAAADVLWPVVCFCVGMCVSAPFCNYLLDAFRRKSVALFALAFLACSMLLFYGAGTSGWVMGAARLSQGAAYAMFQIAAGSTLLLDLSDTRKRTEAAHVYYWFQRLAVVAGLLAGRVAEERFGLPCFLAAAEALLLLAFLLTAALRVPFRAPLQPALFSLDRFWLPRGFRLFVPLASASAVAGLLLARHHELSHFLCLALGLWLALSLHILLFRERLERELAAGYILLLSSCLLSGFPSGGGALPCAAVLALGCGIGCVASRYLLSYIRICEHCERGTAQTSYLLGWEAGLVFGFSLSSWREAADERIPTYAALLLCLWAMAFHFFAVRRWYAARKRR